MKNIFIGIFSFLFLVVFSLIGFTIQGRTTRQTELEQAMTSGMEKTMQMLYEKDEYTAVTDEEMVAFFLESVTIQIESTSQLTVNIIEADAEKGLLSAEGILTYKHPIGTEGHVTCKKTIILEQYMTGAEEDTKVIQFLVNDDTYKVYNLSEGSAFIDPGIPTIDGKTFVRWESSMGNGSFSDITSGKTVTDHVTFVAKFKNN